MTSLLVFDYDGVLVDSYNVFIPAFIDACKDAGYMLLATEDEFVQLLDENLYQSMRAKGMTKDNILSIAKKVKEYTLVNQDQLRAFPGMKEAVRVLSANHHLAVVSSNETAVVHQSLTALNLDCFEDIIGSDQEPSKTKSLFHLKKKYEGIPVYYIGDTIGDVKEGRKAGVHTVSVSWGWHGERVADAMPDYLVTHPLELVALFNDYLPTQQRNKHL